MGLRQGLLAPDEAAADPLPMWVAEHYERNILPPVNVLDVVAAETAYTHGEPWLEESLTYLRGCPRSTVNEAIRRLTAAVAAAEQLVPSN